MIRRPPRSTLFPSPTLSRSLPPPGQLVTAPRQLLLRLEQLEPRCEPLFTCPGHVLRHRSSLLRSEEHTSELQSRQYLVCRLLLEKKKIAAIKHDPGCRRKNP